MAIVTPEKFKGKEAFYEKMLRLFASSLPESWPSFDAAAADLENIKVQVHTIKGTAGNLDVTEVHQCALQFEASVRNGQPDKFLYAMFVDACNDLKTSLPPPE
ncbi:MAG: Hpt domain-containing protein [Chitinispirillia bacterium]|nr:Hpt domain-containing protein [Chitinispirillia bacterium]MCL2268305.1 Hpt domain-containing protein [Chitinispirillia bacterium]